MEPKKLIIKHIDKGLPRSTLSTELRRHMGEGTLWMTVELMKRQGLLKEEETGWLTVTKSGWSYYRGG